MSEMIKSDLDLSEVAHNVWVCFYQDLSVASSLLNVRESARVCVCVCVCVFVRQHPSNANHSREQVAVFAAPMLYGRTYAWLSKTGLYPGRMWLMVAVLAGVIPELLHRSISPEQYRLDKDIKQ